MEQTRDNDCRIIRDMGNKVNDQSDNQFFKAHDGLSLRYGIWPCRTPHATALLLHGRAEFIEKYRETIGELNQRGFLVYSMDWRGQGLSGRLLEDRLKGYVESYDDYRLDLERFVEEVVTQNRPGPLILLAHSMGGHIALRYLRTNREAVDGAVLCSPMLGIRTNPFPLFITRLLVRTAMKTGLSRNYVPGAGVHQPGDIPFENNRLTSDPRRFEDHGRAIAENPKLAIGGVTFGWLAASFASIDRVNRRGFLESITAPIRMVVAGSDRIVSLAAQKKACSRLPNCRMQVIPEARHEILKETDRIRNRFWQAFDGFYRTIETAAR